MTLFELERGVRQMERRDAAQGSVLRRWLRDQIMTTYEQRTLPLYRPIRKIMPDFGALDLSPMVVLLGLIIVDRVLLEIPV